MGDKFVGPTNVSNHINVSRIQKCETKKSVEKKEEGVSRMTMGDMATSIGKSSSAGDNVCGKHAMVVMNGFLKEVENVEKPKNIYKRRKRGADGEIADVSLLSDEKSLSKLRPRRSVLSFRKVELSDNDFERIVGKRVKVYWSGSRKWFAGCIKSFDNDRNLHRILYDDGEREDLDLRRERFELEVMSSEGFSICPTPGSSNEKKATSDVGEVCEDAKRTGSPNMSDVVPLKRYMRMNIKTSSKPARFELHEGKAKKEKPKDMAIHMEVDVHPKNHKDQVTSDDDAKCVTYGDGIDDENKGHGASGVPFGNEKSTTVEGIGDDCRERGDLVKNSVPPEEENVVKPPKKRKRGADGDIAKPSFLSSKESVCYSKLRPRNFLLSFQKVELNEKDFERIVGKRVKVYWPTSRRWFVGCIKSFDNEKKLHKIIYDGGDKEDVDLRGERFELEVTSNEGFNICSKLGTNSEKKEMSSGGGEVREERNRNAWLSEKHESKGAERQNFQLHGRKFGDKTEDTVRDMEVNVQPENKDLLRSSENTYWYMYDEACEEMRRNGSPGVAHDGQMHENVRMGQKEVEKAAKKERFQLHEGTDTEEETEDMVRDAEVDVQSENVGNQIASSENTYWYMYVAQEKILQSSKTNRYFVETCFTYDAVEGVQP